MSYVTITRDGGFCNVCGATLGQEEIDFECCDCCGGEGFGEDEADDDMSDDELDKFVASVRASRKAPPSKGGKP